MYGDSHALSPDSNCPIFPSNSDPIKEEDLTTNSDPIKEEDLAKNTREHQFVFMESDSNTNYYTHQNNNSGLLRFRPAPSFLLENYRIGVESKSSTERLMGSRFFGDEENNNRYTTAAMNAHEFPPPYPRQIGGSNLVMDGGEYVDNEENEKNIGYNLLRQKSSPAGLFSHINSHNGYGSIRSGIGTYRMAEGGTNADFIPSSSRMRSRINLSSNSLGMLSRITEIDNESAGPDDEKTNNLFYNSGFPYGSWSDSSNFMENFGGGIKRELDNDHHKLFATNQNEELGNRPHGLSYHLSLPKSSSMDKFLQLQDSVPCKLRAKRGCATHPRSIAERVRRTRISERMRKLQDLVPNMDKQTNTSDMLDLAVDYIKDLQKQYKTLSDSQANCKCSAFKKTDFNQIS